MNTNEEQMGSSTTLPHAIIQKKKGISFVWIVPFVAVIIAAGLVYKTYSEKGCFYRSGLTILNYG